MEDDDEDPFELIQKGNGCEASCDHWRAADHYGRASRRLLARADDLAAAPTGQSGHGERQKVVARDALRSSSSLVCVPLSVDATDVRLVLLP